LKIFFIDKPIAIFISKKVNRQNFGERSGVVVDRCKAHGVWLDSGEFRRLAEWMKAGGQILADRIQVERTHADFTALRLEGRSEARWRTSLLGLIVGAVAEGLSTMTEKSGEDE